jgi:hypothetical protein
MVQRKILCMLVVCVTLLLQPILVQADDAPYINPLGDLEDYWSVSFIPVSDLYDPWIFGYVTDDEYQYEELWGNIWHLEVPGDSLAELLDYLEAFSGTIFSYTEEELLAQIPGPQGDWWVQAAYWGEDYYELTVIEEVEPPDLAGTPEDDDDTFALPLINPLNDLDAYYSADYWPPDLFEIPYNNSLGEQAYLRGQGETWVFYAPTDDADPLQGLEEHVLELGAAMTERSPQMLSATLIDSFGNLWQAVAQYGPGDDHYMLYVTKEQVVGAGQTLTIHPQPDQEWVSVVTFSDGLNHKSLIIELSNGTIEIQPSLTSDYGAYTRSWDEWIPVYHERTPIYVLDYIPQEPGKTIWWMRFQEESRPEEIRVTLKESVPLPPLSLGSQLGVLRVIGATDGDLDVEPSLEMSLTHPEFENPVPNQTPEGDHIFYLPAGYWDIRLLRLNLTG